MIRNLVVLLLLVSACFFAVLHLAYHSMDPCRALAVEEARRSALPTSIAHVLKRTKIAKMDRVQCTRELLRSWQDRLSR
jgi:hypothetical protein